MLVCACGCFVLKINLFNFLSDNRRSCHSTRLPSEQCVHKISVSIIFLLLTNIENVFFFCNFTLSNCKYVRAYMNTVIYHVCAACVCVNIENEMP